jgi:hypothetical protein
MNNCFKCIGALSELHIEFHNTTIKSRLSIQCEQNVIDVQFYINKKYAQQEYYDFISAIGISYKWIKQIDSDKYVVNTTLISPRYTGKCLIYDKDELVNLFEIPCREQQSKLFISGNLSSGKNDKIYYNARYIEQVNNAMSDIFNITLDGAIQDGIIYNHVNDEVRGIKICG